MKCKYAKRMLAVAVTAAMLAASFDGSVSVNAETAQTAEQETEAETQDAAENEAAVETEAASGSDAVTEADEADQSDTAAETDDAAGKEAAPNADATDKAAEPEEAGAQSDAADKEADATAPETGKEEAGTKADADAEVTAPDAAAETKSDNAAKTEEADNAATEAPKQDAGQNDAARDDAQDNTNDAQDSTEDTSGQYDTTAPVIESVAIDKQGQTVGENGSFKISLKAYDADSGIQRVTLLLGTEGTYSSYSYSMDYNEQTGYYETTIYAAYSSFHGKTYVQEISVTDQTGNTARAKVANVTDTNSSETYASADNAINWVTVNRNDNEKPVIESVEIEEAGKTLNVGDTVHVKVKASDNVALSEWGSASFSFKENGYVSNSNRYGYAGLQWDETENCYKGTFEITEKTLPGDWYLSDLNICDTSANEAAFDSKTYSDKTVTVKNDSFDLEAPKIKSFTMNNIGATLTAGGQVKFTVGATDNKEVASVRVILNSDSDGNTNANNAYCDLQKVEGTADQYEGTYTVTATDYPCEWFVTGIRIEDSYGNYLNISNANALDGTEHYRPLYYDYYYNVTQKGTFVQKTYNVKFVYLNADKEWETKEFKVPRRTTAEQLKQLFTPDVHPEEANFIRWNLTNPLLYDNSSVKAVYDKALVSKVVYSRTRDENGIFKELYSDLFFANQGDRIELPTSMPGIKNIEWYYSDDLEIKDDACILTGDQSEYYFEGEGDSDGSTPAIDDNKNNNNPNPTDNNKGNGGQNEGTKLSSEKIQENVTKIKEAKAGDTISVSMGDATVAPKDILEAAKGKDIDVVLEMNGYKWTINGKNIKADNLKDINLAVNTNANAIPNDVVSNLAGSNPVKQISLAYSGDFGFQASLSYNIGNEYAGKFGNLYYYDSTGRMIFQNAGAIDASGNVSLTFSHASEYAVVITDTPQTIGDQNPDSTPNNDQTTNGGQQNNNQNNASGNNAQSGNAQTAAKTPAAQSAKTAKAPVTGDNNAAALYLVLCGIGIVAAAIAVKKKKNA